MPDARQGPAPVHLVVDTGVDDALAIVAAALHPALRLVGVTASAGNVSLARSWTNTEWMLGLLRGHGLPRVPITRGAGRRLDGSRFAVRAVHGPTGLAGLGPAVEGDPAALPPLEERPDGLLVCLAPLTTLVALEPGEVVATYAVPGQANAAMDATAAAIVRAAWTVRDAPAVAPSSVVERWMPPLQPPTPAASLSLPEVVDRLLAHQAARGVGLGDADVVLRLAGSADPVADLRRLVHGAAP